jgi:hypothetical protein
MADFAEKIGKSTETGLIAAQTVWRPGEGRRLDHGPRSRYRGNKKVDFFKKRDQSVCFDTLFLYSTLYPNSDKKRINGKNYRISND